MKNGHLHYRHMFGSFGDDTFEFFGNKRQSDTIINGWKGEDTLIIFSHDDVVINHDHGGTTIKGFDFHGDGGIDWLIVVKNVEHFEIHHI